MPDELLWPESLLMNAWTGEEAVPSSVLHDQARAWVLQNIPQKLPTFLFPTDKPDELNWSDSRVGWGLVLPMRGDFTRDQIADLADVPESLRQLWKDRGSGPVLRYDAASPNGSRLLFDVRNGRTVTMEKGTPQGTTLGALPRYLLICGTPEEVPWEVQYRLNPIRAVGRLPFALSADGDARLDNYIARLRDGWKDCDADFTHTLVWATENVGDQMASLMRTEIAERLNKKYAADEDLKTVYLAGADATAAKLKAALESHRPGLIVTTSHGQTGPAAKPEVMRDKLGMLIDQGGQAIGPDDLPITQQPEGAIWYAHACCSAGCTSMSEFDGLFSANTGISKTLQALTTLGSRMAPLPVALLGSKKPVRAFVGHVEPTFNYSLRQPANQESLTSSLEASLYTNIFQKKREPVGYAFRDYHERVGGLFSSLNVTLKELKARKATLTAEGPSMLWSLLVAVDLRSTMILGDPTVILPRT